MTVTLTGTAGFIGRILSQYLINAGMQVDSLSVRSSWHYPKTANAIIHLAGKAHDTSNTTAEEEYFTVNTELTKKLFDAFVQSDTRDFFFFSSVKAAADTVEGALTEAAVPAPQTPYGRSKRAAEEYLLSHELPAGKRLFIIRPAMVHGPGNKGNLNLLYNLVRKGLPWPLATFENKRSFISITNLSFLIEKMLTNPELPSGIYNFADDEPFSTNQIITVISTVLGQKTRLWHLPASVINLLARTGDFLKFPLNTERLQKLTDNYFVSNQKIKSALGLKKLPLSAQEGLELTIRSFKQS